MLELSDLTPDQYAYFMKYIYNGVGSRELPINPPDLIFDEAAKNHDFRYWRGGPDSLRKIVDHQYFEEELIAVRQSVWWKRPAYYSVAYFYYGFLVLCGKYAWEYADEPCRTWEEVKARFDAYNSQKTYRLAFIKKMM